MQFSDYSVFNTHEICKPKPGELSKKVYEVVGTVLAKYVEHNTNLYYQSSVQFWEKCENKYSTVQLLNK